MAVNWNDYELVLKEESSKECEVTGRDMGVTKVYTCDVSKLIENNSLAWQPEKGSDLFEEGIKRYCKHSQLQYLGMLCERHLGYSTQFLDDDKISRAREFAEQLSRAIMPATD